MNFDSALSLIDYSSYSVKKYRHPWSVLSSVFAFKMYAKYGNSVRISFKLNELQILESLNIDFKLVACVKKANRLLAETKTVSLGKYVLSQNVRICYSWAISFCRFSENTWINLSSSYLTHKYCLIMTFIWKYDELSKQNRKT